MKHIVICGMICVLVYCVNTARAEDKIQDAKLRIERIALFKNGLGFFTSDATLPENAKTVRFGQLPVPSFGTFWVGYPKDVKVRSLVTSMEDWEEKFPVQSIGQLLQANAGRKVTLRTGPEDKDVVEGTVVSWVTETEVPEPPNPYFMEIRRRQDPNRRYVSGVLSGNVLLIKTDKGTIALNAGSITRADFGGSDIITSVPTIQKLPSIRMELDRPANGKKVSISYLARGVTWAPSYLIDLSDVKTARFSAHALVVNELADFKNVKLDLVTGFPNIKFGEVLSPIAMSESLADFLNSLASGRTEAARGRREMLTQQAVLMNVPVFDAFETPPIPGYSTVAEGLVSEDLFLYPVDDFTLKRGETAWIPLFTAEMPYKHIYTWKIGDFLDKEDRYRAEAERADGKIAEEVWHSCRLVNNLKMPLTTAAAEFVKDGAFTGQDVCYYTAPGAETTIRINRAMNVLAEEAEVEVERRRNAATFYGYQYDLVKVRGELKLRSRIDKPVNVEVTKELSGEILETLPDAKDVQTAKGLKQVNPKHVLTWEIELKSGDEQKLSYLYQVYIRD
jgi:hypothetical protein